MSTACVLAAWMDVTKEEFDDYRLFSYNPDTSVSGASNVAATSPTTQASKSADRFRKSIKPDKMKYPILYDEWKHIGWHQRFEREAKAQGLGNIIDSSYRPIHAADKELFVQQQRFFITVLDRCLLTEKGVAGGTTRKLSNACCPQRRNS